MRRTIEVRGAACSVLVEIEWTEGGDDARLTAAVGDEVFEVFAPDAPALFVHHRRADRSGSPLSPPTHRSAPVERPVAGVLAARAPLPGLVLDILVAPGDRVRRGQPLLVLEAMKMQNPVARHRRRPREGGARQEGRAGSAGSGPRPVRGREVDRRMSKVGCRKRN